MDIIKYLKKHGACYSPQLIRLLEGSGCNKAAARQRISRAVRKGQVKRLKGISFPKQSSFLYLESTFNTPEFWDELMKVIDEFCPAYSAAVHALRANGSLIKARLFSIISGSPVAQSGQISSESVLERLEAINLIQCREYIEFGECISFTSSLIYPEISITEFKAKALAESILITAVKDWARKANIVSYNAVKCRDDDTELPRVGTFHWDIAGPCFLKPFLRKSDNGKLLGGFFVCDVMVDTVLDEKSIQAYIRKCRLTSYIKKLPPVLFCLVVKGFTQEAFRFARGEGIVACTTENLFGKDVAEGLASLISTLTRLGEMAAGRPEIVDELFKKLGHIEGAANNIRGAMFELLVGHSVKKMDDGSIDIGKRVRNPDTGQDYEIDVFRVKENREVWVYECKAHQPTELVNKEDVEFWCKKRVAPIFRILRNEPCKPPAFRYTQT